MGARRLSPQRRRLRRGQAGSGIACCAESWVCVPLPLCAERAARPCRPQGLGGPGGGRGVGAEVSPMRLRHGVSPGRRGAGVREEEAGGGRVVLAGVLSCCSCCNVPVATRLDKDAPVPFRAARSPAGRR